MGLRQNANGTWTYTLEDGAATIQPQGTWNDPTLKRRRTGTLPAGAGDPSALVAQPTLTSAQLPYVGTNSFVGGGGTKYNAPKRPFVTSPGSTVVHGTETPAVNATAGRNISSPSLASNQPGFVNPNSNPMDPLYALALKLSGDVGAYPGAVPLQQINAPKFDRWQRPTDLSGIFDPIQAEYAPVIDTLYNNLQGSLGNIQQNQQGQWQDARSQLENQWTGLEQDQQQAFAERDQQLRDLATSLGVPESAMMTDPSLERWGRENERLKQLNATMKTGSMGTLDTVAQAQNQGIGAYDSALDTARGQSQADMLLSLATQKGQLGSDLLGLESQYNTNASLAEMSLQEQLYQIAQSNADKEYDRRVQGWSMRNQAAQDAMKNWEDFYLQKQKQEQDAKNQATQNELFKQFTQANDSTKVQDAGVWAPIWQALEARPELLSAWQNQMGLAAGNPDTAWQSILKTAQGPNVPRFDNETTGQYINRLAPSRSIFDKALQAPRAISASINRAPTAQTSLMRQLQAYLEANGIFGALNAGRMGLGSTTTTNQFNSRFGNG